MYNTTCNVWKVIFDEFIEPYGGDLIFYCNVQPKQINMWKVIPQFYKRMLKVYFSFINPDNVAVINQMIWHNHNICVASKPLFDTRMHAYGINLVSDLYNVDGTIIPFDVWVERGVPHKFIMLWRSIIHAIPLVWKRKLRQGFVRRNCISKGFILIENDVELPLENMTSKKFYRILVKRIFVPPTSQRKFSREMNIKDTDWKDIYILPFVSTMEIRTRIFQYKIAEYKSVLPSNMHMKGNVYNLKMVHFCSDI